MHKVPETETDFHFHQQNIKMIRQKADRARSAIADQILTDIVKTVQNAESFLSLLV